MKKAFPLAYISHRSWDKPNITKVDDHIYIHLKIRYIWYILLVITSDDDSLWVLLISRGLHCASIYLTHLLSNTICQWNFVHSNWKFFIVALIFYTSGFFWDLDSNHILAGPRSYHNIVWMGLLRCFTYLGYLIVGFMHMHSPLFSANLFFLTRTSSLLPPPSSPHPVSWGKPR